MRLKVHWVLHGVPDEEVKAAFVPYGKVVDVSREQWRVSGCLNKGSTTRLVTLKLKPGITPDDIPHQLRIARDNALVVVPGRTPLCLRCHRHGHIRRECRVPRCSLCRRFGHVDADCVQTYASVTGPAGSEDKSEHLMDEADAEEAAGGAGDAAVPVSPPENPEIKDAKATEDSGETPPSAVPATPEGDKTDAAVAEVTKAAATATRVESEAMEVTEVPDAATSGAVTKRQRESTGDSASQNNDNGAQEEPPAKAVPGRRASLKPKPERRPAATPWASQPP